MATTPRRSSSVPFKRLGLDPSPQVERRDEDLKQLFADATLPPYVSSETDPLPAKNPAPVMDPDLTRSIAIAGMMENRSPNSMTGLIMIIIVHVPFSIF
ncbi:unnamed protein product [Haemonchus placei]|uniref:TORC_N domain-containing protein n=1 Tax=Haemonchus placei TaxID=6290 RepID=A0A0N4W7X7_HAEPC|nr:unnamed protein product [Haemonchus placei]